MDKQAPEGIEVIDIPRFIEKSGQQVLTGFTAFDGLYDALDLGAIWLERALSE